jgi:hypothetical protein
MIKASARVRFCSCWNKGNAINF